MRSRVFGEDACKPWILASAGLHTIVWAHTPTHAKNPNGTYMALVVVASAVGNAYGDFIASIATGPQVDGVGLAHEEDIASDASAELTCPGATAWIVVVLSDRTIW